MIKTRGNLTLRFLDRYVGIPLVRILSAFRRKRLFPKNVKTIGLLKLSGIGDLIVLSGVLKDIRASYPDSQIILFCGPDNRAIAPFLPGVSKVESLSVVNVLETVQRVRSYNLDLLLDCEQWSRIDVLMGFFSKASYLIGFKTAGQHRHYLFDAIAHHKPTCHEVDNFRKLARLAQVHSLSGLTLTLEPAVEQKQPFVIFHPWSISRMKLVKEWPEERWIELGNSLRREGFAIFVTGGKNDIQQSAELVDRLNQEPLPGQAVSLAGKTTFVELADYLKKASCVISVDTGVMHLAAALDVPLIALFGPTSPKRWGPLSRRAIALASPNPYMYLGFEFPKNPPACMRAIAVEEVIAAFQSLQKSEVAPLPS